MPTRGEMKVWRPRMSDAFRVCETMTAENCTCRATGKRPCQMWRDLLRDCHIHGWQNHAEAERHRVAFNRQHGTSHRFASNCGYTEDGSV